MKRNSSGANDDALACYVARTALPRLRKLLAAVDSIPLRVDSHRPWLAVRALAVAAINEHVELLRLWNCRSPREKSMKNP